MGSALWWGIGALVVSIPIIIHLLHRQRTQPVLWGAMIFLRMSMLQQKRRKRVEHWLLMLLRLALLALLVLLLGNVVLKPGFIAAVTTGGSRSSADIAIIVDHSLSTQWRSGDKAVFQHEVAAVSEWTKSDVFKQGDTITIILAEKTPRVLCEAGESSELPGWVQKLSALPPGSTRASIPAAIQSAREVLNRRGKNASKMILVVSDEQRDNWEVGGNPDQWAAAVGATARGIDPTAKVYSIPVKAASQQSNLAVEGLKIDPEREVIPRPVGANRAVKIQASIRNTGKTEMPGATASLWVDGIQAKDSKGPIQVNVRALPAAKPGESTGGYIETVSFSYAFPKPKSCVVEVRVDVAGDGFPADNAAVGSVTVMEPLPVLIIDRQSGDPADESNPAALQKYHASELLVSAMLSDAPTADAPPLMSPTIISASDNAHLRELTKEGLLITTRNAEGKPVSIRRTLDDFAAVILNDVGDLDQTFASRLNDYMASGHGVWCILGESTSASYLRDQISGTRLFPLEVPERLTEIGAPKQVQVKDNQYPVLLNFNTAQNRYLEGMTSQKLWAVTPASDGTVPLTTPDGLPLILDRPAVSGNGGRVILWTTPISGSAETRGWNNWTTMKMFSPIVNRTLYLLTAGVVQMQATQFKAGDTLPWFSPPLHEPVDAPAGSPRYMLFSGGIRANELKTAELVTPSGEKHKAEVITTNARQRAYFAGLTNEPGKYEIRFPEQSKIPPFYYGVGIDQREMDTQALSAADVQWLTAPDHKFLEKAIEPATVKDTLFKLPPTMPKVWPWAAGLLLAFLLLETFLTYRMVRRQTSPSESLGAIGAPPMAQPA